MLVKSTSDRKSGFRASDIGLASDSFRALSSTDMPRSAIINIEGMQKTGKTDFALRHAPDPIVIFNFDQGLRGMVEKHVKKGRRVIVAGLPQRDSRKMPSYHFARPVPIGAERRKSDTYLKKVKELAYPMWERFIVDYRQFLESEARTGVIDTGGGAFQLAKFAFHGMDKVMAADDPYGQKGGEMKAIFQGLILDGQNYPDKNIFWLHRLKEDWKGGQPSGNYKVDGYNQLPFETEVTFRLTNKKIGKEILQILEIRDCRLGRGRKNNGITFGGPDDEPIDFGTIMSTLMPQTTPEDWR